MAYCLWLYLLDRMIQIVLPSGEGRDEGPQALKKAPRLLPS